MIQKFWAMIRSFFSSEIKLPPPYPEEDVKQELTRAEEELRELNERVRYNRWLVEQWKHSRS